MQNSRASSGEEPQAAERQGTAPPATEPQTQPTQDELAGQLAQTEDRYKRALADLDNYRKRSAREVQRRAGETREALLRDWLDVVDSVERALRMGSESEGMRAVLDQIEAVLERQGAQRIGAAGERFDPERHDAVDVRLTDEVEDRTVLEVLRSGFALDDRVLRPAQVVVARRDPPPD